MKISIDVENIRCGGCANTITKKLSDIEGINAVEVAIEEQVVTIDTEMSPFVALTVAALLKMGYPRKVRLKALPHSKARQNRLSAAQSEKSVNQFTPKKAPLICGLV